MCACMRARATRAQETDNQKLRKMGARADTASNALNDLCAGALVVGLSSFVGHPMLLPLHALAFACSCLCYVGHPMLMPVHCAQHT